MIKKSIEATAIDISTADLRQSLGEVFDRVQYSGSRYVVNRKGRPIGAIVPVELARKLELLEQGRVDALARLTGLLDQKPDLVGSDEEATEIANDLVDEVRRSAAP
jgi:prevent-host-death family protein